MVPKQSFSRMPRVILAVWVPAGTQTAAPTSRAGAQMASPSPSGLRGHL